MAWAPKLRFRFRILALCGVLLATGAQAQDGTPLGVAPAIADEAFRPIDSGFAFWIQGELAQAGFETAPLARAATRDEVLASAAAQGYTRVLVPRLRKDGDVATVQLSLFAPDTGALLAGSLASGNVAEFGTNAAAAATSLLAQLGADPSITPPLLDDLSHTTRALEAWNEGKLLAAWRAVQGKLSPRAMDIRDQLAEEARTGTSLPAERARVLTAAGDPTRAWKLIKTVAKGAVTTEAPDLTLLLAIGEIKTDLDQRDGAAAHFERALVLDPASQDAALGLAEVLVLQGQTTRARTLLAKAAKQAADDTRAVERLAALHAGSALEGEHWVEASRRSARRLQIQHARAQLERAEAAGAAAEVKAAQALGSLEERLGRPNEALRAYRRAKDGGENTAIVLTAIGRNQHKLGQSVEAQQTLEAALELAPTHADAAEELGVVHLAAGRGGEALALLQQARKDRGHATPGGDYTMALALRTTGSYEEALSLLRGEFESPKSLRLAAEIQEEQGDLDAAATTMSQAIALDPDDPASRSQLALLLEGMGDAAGAAAQRQWAGVFTGQAPGSKAEEETTTARRSLLSLDDLVLSFAKKIPNAERRAVALLSIDEPSDPKTLGWRAIRPRSPDLDFLRRGIESAIDARFVHAQIPAEDDAALSHPIQQLRDFESQQSLDAQTVAMVNDTLRLDGIFLTRIIAHDPELAETCGPDAFGVEMRLLTGRDADIVSVLSNFDCLNGGFEAYGRWNFMAAGLYAALLLCVGWPVLRGWGSIRVRIMLPDKTKGFFSIHVNDKPDQVKRERIDRMSGREKLKSSRRFDFLRRYERHMAVGETTFKWIPARRAGPYYVSVGGPLLDAKGEEIIGHFLEEQKIVVRRRHLSKCDFDFRPKECAIEIKVLMNGKPAAQGRVSLRGDPSSLRYTSDGLAFLYLGVGQYTLLAGSHDTAAEYPFEVFSVAKAVPISIDLADGALTLFSGCPEAVEAYLQSDFARAADALEASGQTEAAHLLRADHLRQQGRGSEAAAELEAAGQLQGAAALRADSADFTGSAALFEEAGEHDRAAQAYRDAGQWLEAGRCYEEVYDYGNALECWREAGDSERELNILEKLGESMDAASLARELGDDERAIRNLQQVDGRHAYFSDACKMIAEIASQNDDHDLAISKIEEAIASVGDGNASVETLETYAQILERAGKQREALTTYETIRRRDVSRTDVATRIQDLKSQLSASESGTAAMETEVQESRYELIEEIGRGGMGVVYKARDKRLGRVVALKRLPDNMREHPAALALFEREARAAAALNHVNIVTLFDAGEEGGHYFITMEMLEGKPLNTILQHNERISPPDTCRLGIQICAGLQYAHQNKIVHRDIKTANLFFTKDQTVKIMDFGIAKSMEEVRRATTVVGGTPYYMAPEQAAGEAVDHRADLYALGVTFFQLLTGSLPFADGDVSYRHRHEAPPDPRELNLEVPEGLAQLVLQLMQKEVGARPESAAAVAARLKELARG
jgi:tetratricopeptide (TPR) repeat protein